METILEKDNPIVLLRGHTIGQYKLIDLAGRGESSVVHKAFQHWPYLTLFLAALEEKSITR